MEQKLKYSELTEEQKEMAYNNYIAVRAIEEETSEEEAIKNYPFDCIECCRAFYNVNGAIEVDI